MTANMRLELRCRPTTSNGAAEIIKTGSDVDDALVHAARLARIPGMYLQVQVVDPFGTCWATIGPLWMAKVTA